MISVLSLQLQFHSSKFQDSKKGFNNFGKDIKRGANDIGKDIKRGATNEWNQFSSNAKDFSNDKIKQYKGEANKFINLQLDNAKKLGSSKLNQAIDQGEQYANMYANKISDYANSKANQLANQGMDKFNNLLEQGNQYLDQKLSGGSLRQGRFKKGSVQAKQHMANLRAMRKMKGGSVWTDIGKSLKKGVYKIGDELKHRGANFVNNELRDSLRDVAHNATTAGISGLKSVGNYVMPGNDLALTPAFDRLQQVADRQINRGINKIHIKGGAINPITNTPAPSMFTNEGLHYNIHWSKPKMIKGKGFIQVML